MTTVYEPITTYARIPGGLTLGIMGVLWRAERPLPATTIQERLQKSYKPVAITTVTSTLSRLIVKGWISKPRAHVYQAVISKRDLSADVSDYLATIIDKIVMDIEDA